MAKRIVELHFPIGGLNKRGSAKQQPPYTSPSLQNVRPSDTIAGRDRGGSRPGLGKSHTTDTGSNVRNINTLRFVSGGVLTTGLCVVAGGSLWAGTGTTLSVIGSGLPTTRAVWTVDRLQKLYIANTTNIKVYDPVAATYADITASAGTAPTGRTIIVLWRDRIALAGGVSEPNSFEMSRQGDPTDWDFAEEDEGAAFQAQGSLAGQLGEPIKALVPHSDDCLLLGCTNSLWILRGDPRSNGQIDRLSSEIGILDQSAWCYTPAGWLFFLTLDGLYVMAPGCGSTPMPVSRRSIPEELLNVDPSTTTILMAYDIRDQGMHLYLTKNDSSSSTHWWITVNTEEGGGANAQFFPQTYQTDHEPLAIHARRSNVSTYSQVILGGRDGYLRRHQDDLSQDDGSNAIDSYVYYGPIMPGGSDAHDGIINELIGTTATGSGDVDCTIHVGNTAQEAVAASAWQSATFEWNTAGRNLTERPRARGAYVCFKLANGEANARWAMENITLVIERRGRTRL